MRRFSTLFIDPEVYGNRMNQPTEAPTVRLTQLAHGGG